MPPLEIVLQGPADPVAVGAPIPLQVEVHNRSDHDVRVVGVIDGSEDGTRYPHYSPVVMRDGQVIAQPPRPEDPMVGPLNPADIRVLKPGESFNPTQSEGGSKYLPLSTFANFRPDRPGRYTFRLTLDTGSATPETWLGRFNQETDRREVLDKVGEVPRLRVDSNVLEVNVVGHQGS